jgi:hypothetical protein
MAWEQLLPHSIEELHANLVKLHENKSHVKSVKVDHAVRAIRVDLDWTANAAGHKDFEIPLKSGSTNEVNEIIQVMLGESARGLVPSRSSAEKIYNYIDQGRR